MAVNKNSNLIVGLDIGTSKVVCIVGKYNEESKLEIVALGAYPSRGLKKGFELATKLLMPILFLMLLIMVFYAIFIGDLLNFYSPFS